MKIALVQMRCEKGQVSGNLASTAEFTERAAYAGADLVCFPEMSVTGYIEPQRQPNAVLDWSDPQLAPLFQLSKRNYVTLIAGIVEVNPGNKPFISQGVIRGDELLGVYRKTNLGDDEDSFSAGTEPLVQRHDEVDFGVAICADIDSEGLFRGYAQRGAKLVLLSSAPGLYGSQQTRDWEAGFMWWQDECRTKLGAYARRYGLHIAVATQAGRTVDEDFPGGGYLFDNRGCLVAQTTDGSEGMLMVEVQV